MARRGAGRSRTSVLLLLVAACGLGALNWHLMRVPMGPLPPVEVRTAATAQPGEPVADLSGPVVLPPAAAFSEILSRPLFVPGRRPPQATARKEPEPSGVEDAGEPEPEPVLAGVMLIEGRRHALIRTDKAASGQWVAVNETVAGWTLAEITPDGVVLMGRSGRVSLGLYERGATDGAASEP